MSYIKTYIFFFLYFWIFFLQISQFVFLTHITYLPERAEKLTYSNLSKMQPPFSCPPPPLSIVFRHLTFVEEGHLSPAPSSHLLVYLSSLVHVLVNGSIMDHFRLITQVNSYEGCWWYLKDSDTRVLQFVIRLKQESQITLNNILRLVSQKCFFLQVSTVVQIPVPRSHVRGRPAVALMLAFL